MASKERVVKFNTIVGNPPVGLDDKEKFWEQVQAQAKLTLEEAQEQYDWAMKKNLVEVVDGYCDVDYLQTYMSVLLQEVGVNLGCSVDTVCLNNDQKYSLSKDLALQSQAELYTDKGVDTYISEVEYEGDTYYTVRRSSDNKVMKLLKHVPPNIPATIPSGTMKALSD